MSQAKEKLLDQNVIYLEGEVDGDMVDYVFRCLLELEARESPDIEVRIYTNGGIVSAGLAIYDALHRYRGKKLGVVQAYARSMGAVILQACDLRVCLPHSFVLIHHVNTESVSLDELDDTEELKKMHESMRTKQKALYAILVARTGKDEATIRDTCKKDVDMSAAEALTFGLIDRIEAKPTLEFLTKDLPPQRTAEVVAMGDSLHANRAA